MELKVAESVFNIEIEKIDPNPNQPRKHFDNDSLRDLSESIRRYGVMQPITVARVETQNSEGGLSTRYEIIAGERRWRASVMAGMSTIPALVRESEDTEQDRFELSILENLQREDLNPVDKARSFDRLANEFGMKHAEIADKLGKSREYVTNAMRLLLLPDNILEALSNGEINEGHTRPLLAMKDSPEQMQVLFQEIKLKGLTVRDAEKVGKNLVSGKKAYQSAENKSVVDPEMEQLQKQLSETLGAAVSIDKKQQGGKVTIDFFNTDDIKKLLSLVGSNELDFTPAAQTNLPDTSIVQDSPALDSTSLAANAQEQTEPNAAVEDDFFKPVSQKQWGSDLPARPVVDEAKNHNPVDTSVQVVEKQAVATQSAHPLGDPVSTESSQDTQAPAQGGVMSVLGTASVQGGSTGAAQQVPVSPQATSLQEQINQLAQASKENEFTHPGAGQSLDMGTIEPQESVYAKQAVKPTGTTMYKDTAEPDEFFDSKPNYEGVDASGESMKRRYPGVESQTVFSDESDFVPQSTPASSTVEADVSITGSEFVPQAPQQTPSGEPAVGSSAEVTMGGLGFSPNTDESSSPNNDDYNLNKFSV